jgi:hypothetical protein
MNFCKFLNDAFQFGKYRVLTLGLIFVFNTPSFSAFEKTEAGALPISMGNAVVALVSSPYAIYYNPASLSDEVNFEVILSYQTLYELDDLSQADIIVNWAIAEHPFSIALNQFGNKNYREVQFCVGSKYKITPVCAIGGSIHYYQLSIHTYGKQGTWGLNVALHYDLLPHIQLGALVTNINRPYISQDTEFLPQTLSIGTAYKPIDRLSLCFALFRDIYFPIDYRLGISCLIVSGLFLRIGVENLTNTYKFGLGIKTKFIDIDYALENHPSLGISHIFSTRIVL